ncbi:MAG: 2-C-methyl-D-erythritol 2,4-cyclodiphosphate synthase [Thermoguttaceae bacterium]
MTHRIGLGHDTHRLVAGEAVVLGGVTIPHNMRLDGFSDADVLTHAVIDAVLGAIGLEDIGELFPNTSEVNRGRNSLDMLARVAAEVAAHGYRIVNIDAVVMAERPKISPHKQAMRTNIAAALGVEIDRINVKGKTGEGVGIVGREEAISAECVVLLEKL